MNAFNHKTEGELMGNFLGLRVGVKLGEGRLGEVHELLEHPEAPLGSRLVLKRIHPHLVQEESFRNRLRALFERLPALRHPYAEEVLEARVLDQSTAYLICDRLDGESLAVRLRRDGRLSLALVRQFARQVAEVLAHAHSVGLVHGNLTPRSIIIIQAGREDTASPLRIKLRGFGCGAPLWPGLYGTPSYLAPEQVEPRDPRPQATPLSDQHALACVCHEALVGRLLFPGETVEAVRPRLVRFDAPHFALRGIDPSEVQRVDHALQVALAKDSASRFENLRLFVEALEGQRQASRVRPVPQLTAPAAPVRYVTGGDSAGHRLSSSHASPQPSVGLPSVGPPPPGPPPDSDSDQETQPFLHVSDALPPVDVPHGRHGTVPQPKLDSGSAVPPPRATLQPRRSPRVVPLAVLVTICLLALLWRGRILPNRQVQVGVDTVGARSVMEAPLAQDKQDSQVPRLAPQPAPAPLPTPVVTQLPLRDTTPAERAQPERSAEPPQPGKPPRGKPKPSDVRPKPSDSGGVVATSPKPANKRGRGQRCRSDGVLAEFLWVGRLSACLEHALSAASWPQNFELQLDRGGRLALTSVDDPEADSVAHSCLQRMGAVDVRSVPEEGFTVHCR